MADDMGTIDLGKSIKRNTPEQTLFDLSYAEDAAPDRQRRDSSIIVEKERRMIT